MKQDEDRMKTGKSERDKLRAVRRSRGIFTEPLKAVPAGNVDVSGGGRWRIWQDAGTRIDAPIMGNGDLLAAFDYQPGYPQFWFTTNDFWQMESAANYEFFHDNSCAKYDPAVSLGSPKPVGRLVFDIPDFERSAVEVEQFYDKASLSAVYRREDGGKLEITACVAATENELILSFQSNRDVDLAFSVLFPNETGKGCDTGVDFTGYGADGKIQNGMFTGLLGGMPTQVKHAESGIVSGYRAFLDHVDIPAKVGFAGGFLEQDNKEIEEDGEQKRTAENGLCISRVFLKEDGTAVRIKAGEQRMFVLSVRSWAKTARPYEYAVSRTKFMTEQEAGKLLADHRAWWENYWMVSGIELDDPVVENRYYLSQYMMGSLSRDAGYPPNILGISTFDRPAWNGNYKINYNHQTPYLGLLVAGHFEQSDPHDAPYLEMQEIAREMSVRLLGHGGLYYPLGLGPHGMVSEALLLHMKSPAVHGAINMLMRYELTLDDAYGRKVYPFLRGVADFWECDLVERDGKYHVVGDGMHERVQADVDENGEPEDPVNTLGYLQTFFGAMPGISERLGLDEDKRKTWRYIAEHLADYPLGTINSITENPTLWKENGAAFEELLTPEEREIPMFYDEGKGGKWSFHFPGNIMHIYPGNAIGQDSVPLLKEAAYNTVMLHDVVENRMAERMQKENPDRYQNAHFYKEGAWNADNLSSLFFPAAVRANYDPDKIWCELRARIENRGMPNGYFQLNPHGIETLSMVPAAIHEMMLQSFEGVIRIFPNWPRERHGDASFYKLRAYGAFLVSAELKNGIVTDVCIESLKGETCCIENPWDTSPFTVKFGNTEKNYSGKRVSIDTEPGDRLILFCKS